ncbi:hypothetical protein N7E02_02430 (plasmid) [Aliirhizobium terrae]|uniref:hypothetical protein n=1 Tax=Terrirhizobium terrae TaxID=2926709 RepID=UPI00257503FA|nr:hypothetical protein [Rhizobium sp. CC-CFT758]WJH37697.1 hypothetical protein N7E02_02430 [Rhizobium sp. CC-CFT758]
MLKKMPGAKAGHDISVLDEVTSIVVVIIVVAGMTTKPWPSIVITAIPTAVTAIIIIIVVVIIHQDDLRGRGYLRLRKWHGLHRMCRRRQRGRGKQGHRACGKNSVHDCSPSMFEVSTCR